MSVGNSRDRPFSQSEKVILEEKLNYRPLAIINFRQSFFTRMLTRKMPTYRNHELL